jgi:hypothetical protein
MAESTAGIASPPAAGAPVARLVQAGFFKRWEVTNVNGGGAAATAVVVPPPDAGSGPAESRSREVYVRACAGASLTALHRVKALKAEACEKCSFTLAGGALATVELLRCRRVVLRLEGPVAALKVDDCNDVTVELAWAARSGYVDDSQAAAEGGTSSAAAAATPAAAGMGFSVFSTGSHGVRVSFPLAPGPDAPRLERLVPETLHTHFDTASDHATTAVVDATRPWGAAPAGRAAHHATPTTATTTHGSSAAAGGGRANAPPPPQQPATTAAVVAAVEGDDEEDDALVTAVPIVLEVVTAAAAATAASDAGEPC